MELIPRDMRGWMRRIERELQQLKRHRHPSLSGELSELEQRVALLEEDTGWQQLGPDVITPNWANFTLWRRVGNIVTVVGWVRWDGSFPNAGPFTIGTLPADSAPSENQWAPLYNSTSSTSDNSDNVRRIRVRDTGVVEVNDPADGIVTQGNTLTGNITFPRG